jgi:hypothetical protein
MSFPYRTRRPQTAHFPSPGRSHRPKTKRSFRATPPSHSLSVEALEDRTLLSLFGPAQFFATGAVPNSVAVGDFNRGGRFLGWRLWGTVPTGKMVTASASFRAVTSSR